MNMTTASSEKIRKWEDHEIERSAGEAQRKKADDLRIGEYTIERYKNPPTATVYPLEYAYHLLGDVAGKRILDYGCGLGENTVLLASRGARVVGVDISPELIELAEKRLAQHNLTSAVEFSVSSAHELPLADESVDIVFGMAILHHLDLKTSSTEVFRILKKGGRAIFMEPVRNSNFVKFVRGLIPYQQPNVSPFERPLTDGELREYAKDFSAYRGRAFSLPFVNLLEVLRVPDKIHQAAVKIDGKILQSAGFLNYYATIRVIEITK